MEIRSEIKLHINDYEKIVMLSDYLIDRLNKNKLSKSDRELLETAVSLIYEIRVNQYYLSFQG